MKPLIEALRPAPAITLPAVPGPKAPVTAGLKLGQVLNATVLGAQSESTLTLRVADQKLQARSPEQWPAGTRLVVRVASKSPDLVELQVLPQKFHSPTALSAEALRSVLPKKLPLRDVLSPMLTQSQHPNVGKVLQPVNQRINDRLLKLNASLDGTQLRSAIRDSGVFLESRLAKTVIESRRSDEQLSKDLKANLLQLRTELQRTQTRLPNGAMRENTNARPEPGSAHAPSPEPRIKPGTQERPADTHQNTRTAAEPPVAVRTNTIAPVIASLPKAIALLEAGIANIESQQLFQSADNERPGAPLNLTVPAMLGEELTELQLRILREDPQDSEAPENERQWTVDFEIETASLGQLAAKISFSVNHLDLSIFASETHGFEQLQSEWQKLESALQAIDVPQVQARLIAGASKEAVSRGRNEPLVNLAI